MDRLGGGDDLRGRPKETVPRRRAWRMSGYPQLGLVLPLRAGAWLRVASGVNIVPPYPAQQAGRENLETRKNPVRWEVLPDFSLAAGLLNHLLLDSPLTSGREVRRSVSC